MGQIDICINRLNELLKNNYDAAKGFQKASVLVEENNLKEYLATSASTRYRFVSDLKPEIQKLGGDPADSGSVSGDIHRAWMDIVTNFGSNQDKQVIQECIRGEKASRREYEEILNHEILPMTTEKILNNHLRAIEESLKNVQRLKETAALNK